MTERNDEFKGLPDLGPLDDLPLPTSAEKSLPPLESDSTDFGVDDYGTAEYPSTSDGAAGESSPEDATDDGSLVHVNDSEMLHDAPEEDEAVEADDAISDESPSVDSDSEEDESEDDLSDDAALHAIFTAAKENGGEVPKGFIAGNQAPTDAESLDFDFVLGSAIEFGASDVHIEPHELIAFSKNGEIVRREEFGLMTGAITEELQQAILTQQLEADFVEALELDTSYVIRDHGEYDGRRFRMSVGKTFGDIYFVLRVIADEIPSLDDLGVPPELAEWSKLPNGLVMMNGPTGTGKALALSTVIPTPNGNTTMGELTIGSQVYDSKKNVVTVTGLSPTDEAPELYRVHFADGQTVLADANHQWIVSSEESRYQLAYDRAALRAKRESDLKMADALEAFEFSKTYMTALEISNELRADPDITAFQHPFEVADAFRLMGVPFTLDESRARVYSSLTARFALAARIRDRHEYPAETAATVLTTAEMVTDGVQASRFAVPGSPDSGEEWLDIVDMERVYPSNPDYEPVRCISVDSDDHSYLCADGVVTHNSTTMASLLNAALQTRAQKIITIERPIEYVFPTQSRGYITQREVGQDSREFATALDSAMRQAPDIIMIGESRNHTEIDQVLRAAETGHLTMTTMHTNSAAATVNRIKSLFEGNEQARVLATLADVSRGFANQVLVKKIDGNGRFAVRELLEFNDEVSDLVARGDIKGLRRYQIENKLTMEDGLVKAVIDGRCTVEDARAQSAYPRAFDKMLKELG